jgi:putative tryptophan/tyrosine transport system substrate-binding protein
LGGMRELGYVEGRNLVLEARNADGNAERLDALAMELVRLKVDVILTFGTPASQAAQRTTTTIPIVVLVTADPVRDGFAESMARPGGNMTGMSVGIGEIIQKYVELLRTMVPKLSRVAVVVSATNAGHAPLLLSVQLAAQRLGWATLPVSVRGPDDIEQGFAMMAREHTGAVIILPDSFFGQQRQQISKLALKYRLPSISMSSDFVEAGTLMSYGASLNDNVRRAATFVDKILKGAKPGDLSFELPTRYYLIINRGTAKSLGLAIPQELMLRADRVIE